MSEQGILVVISGFSGAGKGTLLKAMMEKYHNYALSISATTRSPREGEQNGKEYFFVNRESFEKMSIIIMEHPDSMCFSRWQMEKTLFLRLRFREL